MSIHSGAVLTGVLDVVASGVISSGDAVVVTDLIFLGGSQAALSVYLRCVLDGILGEREIQAILGDSVSAERDDARRETEKAVLYLCEGWLARVRVNKDL